MKLRYKVICLALILLITYPLTASVYITYGPVQLNYAGSNIENFRHYAGYALVTYIFGLPALILSIIDEPLQVLLPGKGFNFLQMMLNVIGAVTGMILRQFLHIKISFHNPFKCTSHLVVLPTS